MGHGTFSERRLPHDSNDIVLNSWQWNPLLCAFKTLLEIDKLLAIICFIQCTRICFCTPFANNGYHQTQIVDHLIGKELCLAALFLCNYLIISWSQASFYGFVCVYVFLVTGMSPCELLVHSLCSFLNQTLYFNCIIREHDSFLPFDARVLKPHSYWLMGYRLGQSYHLLSVLLIVGKFWHRLCWLQVVWKFP